MPKQSGGAQNLRRGDRVQIKLNSSYLLWLDGLVGEVTQVLHHGVIVALDNDPMKQQKVLGTGGLVGPAVPTRARRQFMFHEVVKINP